ncbi:DNA-deoxyinosine glycosylase [Paenibacillus sp. GCM10023252]|uniref:DNA-deoxyinosine glycosylase n=1 Tax=Paenibacillus sp. GCM10023252 TaxID=3252649 RepID=UPI003620099B
MRIHSFPPVIDERARVLILGTAPSVKSLEHHQFYAHPRNYLWSVVYGLFGDGQPPDPDYNKRLHFLKDHRLALWDVIESCEREGSLDMNIRNLKPNNLPGLLERYPGLRCFAFNGSKAHETFMRHYHGNPVFDTITVLKLPSTSPIPTPAMRSLEDRIGAWRAIVPYTVDTNR